MAKISSDITESYIAEIGELIVEFKNDVLALKAAPKDEGILSRLLRNLHTMKGNSRMLGFSCVERLSHSVEDVYKSVKDGKIRNSDRLVQLVSVVADKIMECVAHIKRTGSDAMNIDIYLQYCDKIAAGELVDLDAFTADVSRVESDEDAEDDAPVSDIQSIRIKLSRVNEIISSFDTMITREFRLKHQLDEIRRLEEKIGNHELSKIRKQFESDLFALETSIFSVQERVFDLRMLPIEIVLRPFSSKIALEAMQLGKEVVCDIPETDIAIDKVILEQLGDILMHLVRNALDHGIELPEVREKAGKKRQGTIRIECIRSSKHIELTVSDDGGGLDFARIREKAMKVYPERADEISEMVDRELSQFLFQSGFSTRDTVTEISGRGVGLDVVWTNVERIKGRIKIESEPGKGTAFILRIPMSLSTLQGLFVYSNKDKFLVPSQHIVDIIYRKRSEYITLQNQRYIRLESQLIPCFSLSSLFTEQRGFKNYDADSILIAEYMEQRIGIIVEQVQQYVSLVVKPLPKAFKNFSILQGIVFDEHYDIVPILHVPDILKKFKSLRGYDIKKYEAATKKRNIWILVVDDSDTTRHIEKSILENGGFSVDTATDGIDALESLKRKQYDLVLTDKDMPRMNGLVLIDNIRRMEQYKTVPVIVVSADQNPEIKAQFERSGANAFIAKGDFKRGNLISAVQELVR